MIVGTFKKEYWVTLEELHRIFDEVNKQMNFGIHRSLDLSTGPGTKVSLLIDGFYRVSAIACKYVNDCC